MSPLPSIGVPSASTTRPRKPSADRDTGGLAASAHKAALGDLGIVAKEDAADLIVAQVLHHAINAGGEQENFAIGGMLKATDNGNLIANGENRTRSLPLLRTG